jgi:hypothetical protein
MSSSSATTRDAAVSAAPGGVDLSTLSLAELRLSRRHARSQLEVAQLRARQSQGVDGAPIERLKVMVDRLTDELIARYERDPGLIDLILGEVPDEQEGRP